METENNNPGQSTVQDSAIERDGSTQSDPGPTSASRRFLHESMRREDPNYELLRGQDLRTSIHASALLGSSATNPVSIKDFIESALNSLGDNLHVLASFREDLPLSRRIEGIDQMTEIAIRTVESTLNSQRAALSSGEVSTAIRNFSAGARECCRLAKSGFLQSEANSAKEQGSSIGGPTTASGLTGAPISDVPSESVTEPKIQQLSLRDRAVHDFVGERWFVEASNAEIMADRTIARKLRTDFRMRKGDGAKACLDRIRREKGYPLSLEIKKKRSEQ
jgi:hypothetical protein